MLFQYRAKTLQEEIKEGTIEAPNEKMASDILAENNLIILSLTEKEKQSVFKKDFEIPFLNKVKSKDIVIFSRQLAVMITVGLPIVQALKILVKQAPSVAFKTILSQIADDVNGGEKFSQALGKHPKIFSNFFINMIRSGETSGQLEQALNYLADQEEKNYDLASKIKGAMIYPVFVVGGLILVGIVMMIFVVPKLTEVIVQSGAKIPLPTQILIFTSNILSHYWWLLGIIVVGVVFGINSYIHTLAGREQWDFLKLKLPVFGGLSQKIYLVRFSQGLASLIVGGIPLSQGLKIIADLIGNVIYKDLILKTLKEIEDGHSITTVFEQSKVVPSLVTQMMSVGEKTGRLDNVLNKIAEFYSREINNTVSNLTALIEPMVILLLGGAVGIMVAAIIMPMYNVTTQF
ncbi:phytochrome sensor protein [Candidatus Kuenenbacteria bacterium HGW-Kuenenbacteria-1]|uniref:Phytochrome sensor protein n=1 Tax=Candidatus Kuenenbacteria bacterium HGW-Kuenenbacteria-1 TaxID=2013812 RepID=A0A2N1UNX7_9BACT|nr:MAG: phytochrome sensor protein [Candidatus Kuenenbacteria bacterium HGW-Kuenenbacteria-1]